jgi:hypothetical protein
MIYCNLKGGLGNILFQIATAKSMAIDKGTDCSFPNLIEQIHKINADSLHNPHLKHGFEYLDFLSNLKKESPTRPLKTYIYPFEFVNFNISEDDFFIDGFFQSEKYFKHNRVTILDYFCNFHIYDDIINQKYGFINTKKCSSIHVRRGDYLKFPNHHPTQPLEYYLSGIEILKNKTDIFVIFSDDIEWCKDNIKIDNAIYIEGEKDYIELYLMSLCENNITCNSSFSWWGAWLNKNENKVVIGPKIWFGSAIPHNVSDIIPEYWIKL